MKIIDANIAIPKDCFLHKMTKLHGRQVWKDEKGRLYTWDRLHGHVEKFTKKGNHMGSYDPLDDKKLIGMAVNGRKIDE